MEQINANDTPARTLMPRIKVLLQLASDLIDVFDSMLEESNFEPDLALHRQWLEDAKANIQQYREGLLTAALARDVRKVSFWSSQLFTADRYLRDVILPSRNEARMLTVAGEIDDAGRSIYRDIDVFDPVNLETMKAALEGFEE
jgi:hypothetical protein